VYTKQHFVVDVDRVMAPRRAGYVVAGDAAVVAMFWTA
jgi:hypothetical protein